MTADQPLARLDRIRGVSLEAAPGIALRHRRIWRAQILPSLLWAVALLGLFLLPIDYRAGAEHAHAHALPQLWADAADGVVHHHGSGGIDWLDPAVDADEAARSSIVGSAAADVGEQQESAPAAGGLHVLLVALVVLPAVSAVGRPSPNRARWLAGLAPRIPSPPPRGAVAA
jgi:hypothetical protein